jgi:molybdopterin molybdotransferase
MTLEEALQIIRAKVDAVATETIYILNGHNKVLAADVYAPVNVPAFHKSAMDGYACRRDDLSETLEVIEYVPAGKFPQKKVNKGQCTKIMTGAPIPDGADVVVMKEQVEVISEHQIRINGKVSGDNICKLGEDIQIGNQVMSAGTCLQSQHLAVLTGLGITFIEVYKNPLVAVISTGSELVEPGNPIENGQIYNSNGHQMTARIKQLGFETYYLGLVADEYEVLKNMLKKASEKFNVIVISGGVSVGDLDLVPQVVADLGFTIHITQMATKPGKHTLFAQKGNCFILGLPGNPVSSFVQLEMVGKALLNQYRGHLWEPLRIRTSLLQPVNRKKSDRLEFIPVKINQEGMVETIEYHGSAHLHAVTMANALMEFPLGVNELSTEQSVYVRPL